MCGIAGVHFKKLRSLSNAQVENIVDLMLLGIEHRGRDATGFIAATNKGKGVVLDKQPVRASLYIQTRPELPKSPRTVLMHTRFATQGSPLEAGNNHPVMWGDTYVTHNGHIDNDTELFDRESLKRNHQVDTEIIAAMIDKYGFDKINLALKEMDGGYAVAAINPAKHPNELILASGPISPLYVYDTDDFLMWCSERSPIEKITEDIVGAKAPYEQVKFVEKGVLFWVRENEVELLSFPTYDEIHRPPVKPWQPHRPPQIERPKPQQQTRQAFTCKGCNHRLSEHPNRTGTKDQERCIGSDKCNCRKYIRPNRPDRSQADPKEIVVYLGVRIDGVKMQCGVNNDGDLVHLATGEILEWPEDKNDYLEDLSCTCGHTEFAHVGLVNKCGARDEEGHRCECPFFVELRQISETAGTCVINASENMEDVEVQCDGCQVWMSESVTYSCDGALLCVNCKEDWQRAGGSVDQEHCSVMNRWDQQASRADDDEEEDAEKQWMDLAKNEEMLHKYCLMETAGATGYTQAFVDWLLFRCELELMDKDKFLKNARELCDSAYGDAEDAYFTSKTLEGKVHS